MGEEEEDSEMEEEAEAPFRIEHNRCSIYSLYKYTSTNTDAAGYADRTRWPRF
jgi:hypothetical protein